MEAELVLLGMADHPLRLIETSQEAQRLAALLDKEYD
jgi:hypothetical protein